MDFIRLLFTSVLSVVTLFFMTKIMGHRQVAQLDFFDYICGITIGSIAAELATELEEPWKPLLALLIYGGISIGLSRITEKLPRSRKYINGTPTILMDRGRLYRDNLKKAKLDLSEFLLLCREAGYFDLNDIQTAIFECNGKLTVLPISTKRPVTPEDLNLEPSPSGIQTEVIMDGRILEGNLRRLGVDRKWLDKQLKIKGYHDAKEILLGVCDPAKQLTLFSVGEDV